MKSKPLFRVRVLLSYPLSGELNFENLLWQDAIEKFMYYVSACFAFPYLHIRCVNIIKGKKTIKMFQNYD